MGALVPTDVVALSLPYLRAALPDAEVSSRVTVRSKMLKIEAGGGNRSSHVIDNQRLILQSWDADEEVAFDLCADAVRLMLDLPLDPVHGSHVREVTVFGLPTEFPDPESTTPRYQATVELNIRPKEA